MHSKLLLKNAYGLDQSGESFDSDQMHLEETAEPQDQGETPHNEANTSRDVEAEKDFPEITPRSNRFPSRGANS